MFTSRLWLEIQKLVTYEPYLPEKSTSTRKASSKKKKNKTKNSDAKQWYAFLMFTLYSLKSLINVVYSCTFYTLFSKNLSGILNKMWWNRRHCGKKNKMHVCRLRFPSFLMEFMVFTNRKTSWLLHINFAVCQMLLLLFLKVTRMPRGLLKIFESALTYATS